MPFQTETTTVLGGDGQLRTGTYSFPSNPEEPEDFPWLRHDYNETKESTLCLRCRQLNFEYILRTRSPDEICLGEFKAVRGKDCVFCRMATSNLRATPPFHSGDIADDDIVYIWTFLRPSNWETEDGKKIEPPSTGFTVLVKREKMDESPKSTVGIATGTIHAIRERPNNTKHPDELTITPLTSQYDPALIRSWLRDCPGSSSPLSDLSEVEDQPFKYIERFIDTEERRLVEVRNNTGSFEVPPGAPFAALSYVWGKNGQQVTLTKSVKEMFHRKEGIAMAGLLKTIQDSIRVCLDIGIRYLWVDALCIVQDDEKPAKMRQINNLHHIYLNAAVTIVAASGESADAGLPRVDQSYSASRRTDVKIQDMLFIRQCPDLDDILCDKYWTARAWNFQEFILSPRKLIFMDDMIYFSCAHGLRSEQMRGPPHSRRLQYRGGLEKSGLDFKLKTQFAWSIYADIVSNYTTRQLTNERDILPALAAISEVIREEVYSGCPFVSGLPFGSLDNALLWRQCLGCDSCQNASRGFVKREGKYELLTDYPSWSWASWVGHVRYSPWIMGNQINPSWSVIPKIKWLEVPKPALGPEVGRLLSGVPLNIPQESKPIKTWKSPDIGVELYKPTGWLTVAGGTNLLNSFIHREPIATGFENKNLVHPWTKHLFAEADVAKFIVGRRVIESDSIREPGNYAAENNKLTVGVLGNPAGLYDIDSKSHCGMVYNDSDLATMDITPGTACDFIKLSQTINGELVAGKLSNPVMYASGDPFEREVLPRIEKEQLKPPALISSFSEECYDVTDTWCIYNALMVVWEPSERVAFRLGIAKIHIDAFDKASTFRRKKFFLG